MAIGLQEQSYFISEPIFADKIGQAIFTAAIAISNEAPETPNHTARLNLSRMVIVNWELVQTSFLRAVATQLISPTLSDEEINNAVAAVWNTIALAMFPVSE